MSMFKIGTRVMQKKLFPFKGKIGKQGKIIGRKERPFLSYNVQYPGSKKTYEFHKGELSRV